ncbi:restriction modification system DNA specificity subunit [Rhodopirellula europaea SH398]|uniref:Restriction modification system DNA specificity subunit n=2 Tax=Rhodopirellula TaxID=265488 RepID=M5SIE5_9BACT|nr:restriction modification system DNA specificity subunit [Rhodopirellula europaea SH398]
MSEWRECLVEDIAAKHRHAMSTGPFGSAISSKFFVDDGVPVIRGGNLSPDVGVRIKDEGLVFVTDQKAAEFERSVVTHGDIVFTCWGTINQIGLIDATARYQRYIISNKQMKLSVDPKKADHRFIYYLFSSPDKQSEILNNGIGAAVPGFNLGQLKKMPLLLPTLNEQKAIADVLTSLDNKIDLLHRQNKTLEAMAETLFRQWFIEEATDDWPDSNIDEVATLFGGGTPSTKKPEFWDGRIAWTTPRDLSAQNLCFISKTARRITEAGLAKISSGILPQGTLLMSSRAPIGYLAITDVELAINQGYIAIEAKPPFNNYFLYLWCKLNMEEIKNSGNGSTFQEISKASFRKIQVAIPPSKQLRAAHEAFSANFEKIRQNEHQISVLEKIRDTLLPKLMSGEVRVA